MVANRFGRRWWLQVLLKCAFKMCFSRAGWSEHFSIASHRSTRAKACNKECAGGERSIRFQGRYACAKQRGKLFPCCQESSFVVASFPCLQPLSCLINLGHALFQLIRSAHRGRAPGCDLPNIRADDLRLDGLNWALHHRGRSSVFLHLSVSPSLHSAGCWHMLAYAGAETYNAESRRAHWIRVFDAALT